MTESDFDDRQLLELVDQAHRRGVKVRVAPKTTELLTRARRVHPRPGRARSSSCGRRSSPARTGLVKRSFDLVVERARARARAAALARDRGRDQAHLVRAGLLPRPADRPPRAASSGCSSSARCAPTPPRCQPAARGGERGERGAVQDPRRPARDACRSPPAPLLARRGAERAQRPARRDVARRAAAAARARLRPARDWHRQALPRAARDDRSLADLRPLAPLASTTSCGSTSTTSRTGRSGSTSRSSCARCRPCSGGAARTRSGSGASRSTPTRRSPTTHASAWACASRSARGLALVSRTTNRSPRLRARLCRTVSLERERHDLVGRQAGGRAAAHERGDRAARRAASATLRCARCLRRPRPRHRPGVKAEAFANLDRDRDLSPARAAHTQECYGLRPAG